MIQDRLVGRRSLSLTEKNDEKIVLTLSESHTITLLSIPSLIISNETREFVAVEERNAKYDLVVEAHKNADGFSSRPTQTLNHFQKNQNEMAAPNASLDSGCQAVSYDISDALSGTKEAGEGDAFASASSGTGTSDQHIAGLTPNVRKFVRDTVGVAVVTQGCLLNVNDLSKPPDPQDTSKKEAGRKGNRMDSNYSRKHSSIGVGTSRATVHQTSSDEGGDSKPSHSGMVASTHFGAGASNYANDDSEGETSRQTSGNGEGNGAGDSTPAPDGQQLLLERESAAILESKSLLRKLQLTERTLLQNIYHRQHLDYRDLPDVQPLVLTSKRLLERADSTDQLFGSLGIGGMGMSMGVGQLGGLGALGKSPSPNGKAKQNGTAEEVTEQDTAHDSDVPEVPINADQTSLPRLFCYRAESVVRGRPVTAMAWNAANADLLAVGYGRMDFSLDGGQKPTKGMAVDEEIDGGLVLFWSLRNPEHPEKVLRTPYPVTALDFSRRSPTLLAIGLYNGDVEVHDVSRENDWGNAVQSSSGMEDGHTDPVW